MNIEDLTLGELKEEQDKAPDNKEIKEAISSVLNMEVNIKDRGATSSEKYLVTTNEGDWKEDNRD